MRKYRKQEHVENYLRATHMGNPGFCDVFLKHNSLPGISLSQVDTSLSFLGKRCSFPLMINAMTGGSDFSEEINRSLATLALELDIPMAVGSETIAIEDDSAAKSFQVVRDIIGDGMVLGNMNGLMGLEEARKAVDIIQADALQIHLNPAQELIMAEGDRDFTSVLSNIETVVQGLDVPVMVKEVGFGLSKEVVEKLYEVGVRCVDVSGFGGTNFFEVENLRRPEEDYSELFDWGIPTAFAILDAKSLGYEDLTIVGSGGVRSAQDGIKAMVLGADMTAVCGELLSYLIHGGYEYAKDYLQNFKDKFRLLMVLLGTKNLEELKKTPYFLKGDLKDLRS